MAAGIHIVTKRLATGVKTHYVYAWRGGPKIHQSEGERKPKLTASIQTAAADARRTRPDPGAVCIRHLTEKFIGSGDYLRLKKATQSHYRAWIPRIDEKFGDIPLTVFNDPRMRMHILDWRDQWAANPKKADDAVRHLSRILSFGIDKFMLDINCSARIPMLYETDRSFIVWTKEDIEAFRHKAKEYLQDIIDLESCTGLRRTDLAAITWDSVGEHTLSWRTSKSNGKRLVIIPILPETRKLLGRIKARHAADMVRRPASERVPLPPTILATQSWRPWSVEGLSTMFSRAQIEAGIDKHLHDLRGNFVTRLAIAGLTSHEIANIVGWSSKDVEEMMRRYINRDVVARSQAERIAMVTIAG
ncbi:tyrosine-type recombinase/integrase [Sphingomonas sp. T9W2]|uniref:tyrosine-type recombinase/integrase n=1 Tax=Sphingomonas sp. T9W2 TaxID=3143183 RepID=UPI0031F500D6